MQVFISVPISIVISVSISVSISISIITYKVTTMHRSMYRKRPHGHWGRQTASVPKGFVKYHVLRLLKDKPLSGSELMKEIEDQSDGRYKPSPGSIYPLLSWLSEEGYARLDSEESGIKKYTLTEDGEKLLEEIKQKREKRRGGRPPMWGPWAHWGSPFAKEAEPLMKSARGLFKAGWKLMESMQDNVSQDIIDEAVKIVQEASEKLDALAERKST
jgi:DNA-binding PadR family transcriptional regulator